MDLIESAKKFVKTYKTNKVKYSKDKREFGINSKYSDCSSMIYSIFKYSGYDNFNYKTTKSIKEYIFSKGGEFRKDDPKPGDLMMWNNHITLVTEVSDGCVYFAHMGFSGAKIGKIKLSNNRLESEDIWGSGGFLGFCSTYYF